jgi:signal transduction histidine kinase
MKTEIHRYFLLAVLIGASSVSHAQHPGVWRYFPEITLPFVVNFTPEGYALIHNHETVFIYDGYEVKKIHVDSRLGAIQQDEQGRIWSVYNDHSQIMPPDFYGMILYDPATEQWQRFPIPDLQGKNIGDSDCFEFYEPNQLILTNHEKFFTYDLKTGESHDILRREDVSHEFFLSLNKGSSEGVFWGIGDQGILRFTRNTKGEWTWRNYPLPGADHRKVQWYPVVLSDQEIYVRVAELNDEPPSYFLMRFHGDRWEKLTQNYPFHLRNGWADSLGRIWTSGWLAGLIYLQEPGKEIKTIEGNDILGLTLCHSAFCKDDVALIGSVGGLMRHAPALWQPPAKLNPQFSGYDKVLGSDEQGNLWFAKPGQLIRGQGKEMQRYDWKTMDRIEDLQTINLDLQCHPLADGRTVLYLYKNFWDSSQNQLTVYDAAANLIQSVTRPDKIFENGFPGPNKTIYLICKDTQTNLLSLEQFDGATYQPIADENAISDLDNKTRVFYTRSGDIWLLNFYRGPYGMIRKGNYQTIEPPVNHLTETPGNAFLERSDGTIWAGFGYVVYEYDPDQETWKQQLDCTEDIGVREMLETEDGSIWVVARKRIYRLKNGIWVYYNYKEGLPSSTYMSIFKDRQQHLWAVSYTSDSLFCPDADSDPPLVAIPEEENNHQFLPNVNIRITFTAQDRWKYTDTEKLQYSYCLDEGDWSPYSYDPFAVFSDVDPGNHRLQVTAMDVNYNHAVTPAVWEFVVSEPWYKEPGFMIIMTLASLVIIMLLGLLVFRYFNLTKLVAERTEHLANANEQLLSHREKLQALTSELFLIEERERRKLATDLHDSISQSLSLSMLELSSLAKAKAVEEIKEQAAHIRKRLDQTLQSTRNMTYQLCPPLLYQAGLGPAIAQLAEEFHTHHGLVIDCTESGESAPLADELRYFLFRATRELLVNITKHAQASHGNVWLAWATESIRIQVSDDGIGFTRQETRNHVSDQGGYGLFGLRERATRMGGELEIQSIPKQGTIVSLTIPLREK